MLFNFFIWIAGKALRGSTSPQGDRKGPLPTHHRSRPYKDYEEGEELPLSNEGFSYVGDKLLQLRLTERGGWHDNEPVHTQIDKLLDDCACE